MKTADIRKAVSEGKTVSIWKHVGCNRNGQIFTNCTAEIDGKPCAIDPRTYNAVMKSFETVRGTEGIYDIYTIVA